MRKRYRTITSTALVAATLVVTGCGADDAGTTASSSGSASAQPSAGG